MQSLSQNLQLERCPHCSIAAPHLNSVHHFDTKRHDGTDPRKWRIYVCSTCGGVISAWGVNFNQDVIDYFPSSHIVDPEIPDRPRSYLSQAQESLHAPAGAVMLCASAVDAMLKAKGLENGSLYARIEEASTSGLITTEMATWAHEVRLDANDQRHADQAATLPSEQDAKRVLEFAFSLAEFLFVLPARVMRGIQASS
ncbi:DUF4145 domain-containing protein [Xanthomonas graminis]|uniref:DUF4145 domain-containing protein n=1 Tax=Xanthomonas graminis TaxID=3390026 RepID=UPI00396481D8|nr:DUF4145 domain-containing protein [Xanthomonas translucens pv. phleipratensis]